LKIFIDLLAANGNVVETEATSVFLTHGLSKFYGRHHDIVDRYSISVSQMTTDMFNLS
jgi:hypothetical protein